MNVNIDDIILENKLLWSLVDSSYDAFFLTDAEGIVVYCNEAYLLISGLKREQIKNRSICELVSSGEIPDACSPEVIKTKKPVSKVINYYQGVSALVTSTPIFDESGKMVRVFSNVRDITQLTKLRRQLV